MSLWLRLAKLAKVEAAPINLLSDDFLFANITGHFVSAEDRKSIMPASGACCF